MKKSPPKSRALSSVGSRGPIATPRIEGAGAIELARVVDDVGLEDAGERAAMMSPAQLAAVLDEDLWCAAPDGSSDGDAVERFDDARFGLWLEVLSEMGTAQAASRLLRLDDDDDGVVALGLSRMFHVFSTEVIAREVRRSDDDDGDRIEKIFESSACFEIDGWFLVARQAAHVDAAHAVIAELDANHRDDLERILARIADVTAAAVDDAAAETWSGGLLAVLSGDDQIESDVAGARLDRREAAGFVSPADARAFLIGCERGEPPDAIVRAYVSPRTRAGEIAFLANVLVAHDKRAPKDAARAVLACVMRGAARALPSSSSSSSSSSSVARDPMGDGVIASFAIGWRARGA